MSTTTSTKIISNIADVPSSIGSGDSPMMRGVLVLH
jgi:hypothetical protein